MIENSRVPDTEFNWDRLGPGTVGGGMRASLPGKAAPPRGAQ